MSQVENNTELSSAEKALIIAISVTVLIHLILWMMMDSIRLGSDEQRISEISVFFEQQVEEKTNELQEELEAMQAEIGMSVNASNKASNRDKSAPTNRVDNFRSKTKSLKSMDKTDFFAEDKIKETKISDKDSELQEAEDWLGKRAEKKSTFTGESRVNYELKGRVARILRVPVYTCERAGRVWVDILVDRMGRVIEAEVNDSRSSLRTVCAKETAIKYVKMSRFSLGKEETQKGYISYDFVAQ